MNWGGTILEGVNLSLRTVTLLLHLYGIRLLCRDSWKKHFLLINVALTNIMMCLCSYLKLILKLTDAEHAERYLIGVVATGFLLAYFASLFLITLQRFLEVYLHMAYEGSVFDIQKQQICATSWLFSLLYICAVSIALRLGVSKHLLYDLIPHIYESVWQGILVLQFVLVYGYLYVKFRESRNLPHMRPFLRRRTVFVPFIVVLSFIILDTVPGVLLNFLSGYNINLITFLYTLDMLCNSLLYIFIRKDVRRQLVRRIEEERITMNL